MTREKAGALFLLLLFMGYGALAFQIPLIFLSQGETFNARSMPYGIAIAGMVFSLLILILPSPGKKITNGQAGAERVGLETGCLSDPFDGNL